MKRFLLALLLSIPAFGITCPSGFGFQASWTIDHAKVPNTDQTNFAVLAWASDAGLRDAAHSGNVASSTGADILFYSDAAGTTQIASELDYYDATNGIIWAWVLIPTVSHTADTTFYAFYGNGAPPSRTTNPWDANYVGIWHVPNGTSITFNDSTTNAFNGTNHSSTAVAGQVDGGVAFVSASSQYFDITGLTSNTTFNNTTFNVSFWFKTSNSGVQTQISKGGAADSNAGFAVFTNLTAGKIGVQTKASGGGSTAMQRVTSTTVNDGTWRYFAANVTTKSGGTSGQDIQLYLNGASDQGSLTNSAATSFAGTVSFKIGRRDTPTYYDGSLDEIRISNTSRAVDWITTEYNNQSNPGTFFNSTVLNTACPAGTNSNQPLLMTGVA